MSGGKFIQAPDGAIAGDEAWFIAGDQATGERTNPFLHSCCDCGLVHRVEYALAKIDLGTLHEEKENYVGGELIPFPEGHLLALRFSRANSETAGRRKCKIGAAIMSPAAVALSRELVEVVAAEAVDLTKFGEVPIQELDRDALLRIITLLAAGKRKEEPSRIILPGRMS